MKWRWLGQTLRKGQNDIKNQSLKLNPQVIVNWVDQNPPDRENSIMKKLSVKTQQLLLSKKNGKT